IPYSAVTHPLPVLRRKGGTRSSTEAVHSTCVSPNFARHEPSAYLATPGSRATGRIASAARPEGRELIAARPACGFGVAIAIEDERGKGPCGIRYAPKVSPQEAASPRFRQRFPNPRAAVRRPDSCRSHTPRHGGTTGRRDSSCESPP